VSINFFVIICRQFKNSRTSAYLHVWTGSRILKNHPEHLDLTANLSACQARIDFIEKHIPSQTGKINVDQLEHVPITSSFFNSHPNFPQASGPRHPRSDQSRKIKPVKPLDPSRPPPDPDRWLPRREKETSNNKLNNRAAVKNKKAKQKLLTQGSVSTLLPPSADPPSSQKSKQTQRKKKNKK
jgi:signal recognition particle subunit SRP72